jgi:hypothetical protein
MRKGITAILVMGVLVGTFAVLGGIKEAGAQVQVNVNIGPPPIVVEEPPAMVLVPRTQVYFVPEPDVDIFFYNGHWWSPRGDRWYRARGYNGPWTIVERRYVPGPVYRVPRNYRVVYEKERHIPYGQWKNRYKDHRKAEKKAFKQHQKAEHKEFKAHKKQESRGLNHYGGPGSRERSKHGGPGPKEFDLHRNDPGHGPGRG